MCKIEMKALNAEKLTGMREINSQELEEVSGGTSISRQEILSQEPQAYDPIKIVCFLGNNDRASVGLF